MLSRVRISFLEKEIQLRLNHIPLHVHTTFCLPIHLLIDTWVASTFRLL